MKRRSRRRKRSLRKRRWYRMKSERGYNKVYSFSRRYIGNEIVPNASGFNSGSVAPALSQVVNATDFSALFDQYRLTKHVCTFTLVTDPSTQTPVPTSGERLVPTLYWAHDSNDTNAPTDVQVLRERQGCQVRYMRMGVPIRIVSNPSCLIAVGTAITGGALTASNLIPKYRQWLDTNVLSTPHATFKWAIDNANPTSRIRVEQKLYFQAKGVR